MGTRGAYGFRINNQDKLTYNHWDSYPSGLGDDVAQFVRTTSKVEIYKIAEAVQLVSEETPPTQDQIAECLAYADTSVSSRQLTEWYVLLRKAQGDLGALKEGLKYLVDGNSFVGDSLFCEWAYVIDVDTDSLEIYKGFQESLGTGRYNQAFPVKKDRDGKERIGDYTGVALVYTVPMAVLRALQAEDVRALICAFEKVIYGKDSDDEETAAEVEQAQQLIAQLLATGPRDEAVEQTEQANSSLALKDDGDLLRQIYEGRNDGLTVLPPDILQKLEAHFSAKSTQAA
jgi:hypothetical protein